MKRSDRRSTSSKDVQGSSEDRRRRKLWLVTGPWRANVDVLVLTSWDGSQVELHPQSPEHQQALVDTWASLGYDVRAVPAARCFHCGGLLTAETVSPDRIVPGCEGGTYRRENLRPACLEHNVKLGSRLGHERRRAKAGVRVAPARG